MLMSEMNARLRSEAKAYAEEVLRDFIVKLNQLMNNEEEN